MRIHCRSRVHHPVSLAANVAFGNSLRRKADKHKEVRHDSRSSHRYHQITDRQIALPFRGDRRFARASPETCSPPVFPFRESLQRQRAWCTHSVVARNQRPAFVQPAGIGQLFQGLFGLRIRGRSRLPRAIPAATTRPSIHRRPTVDVDSAVNDSLAAIRRSRTKPCSQERPVPPRLGRLHGRGRRTKRRGQCRDAADRDQCRNVSSRSTALSEGRRFRAAPFDFDLLSGMARPTGLEPVLPP